MRLAPLADIDDYTDRYGTPEDVDQVEQRLAAASAAVRVYTGQRFTAGEITQVLRLVGEKVRLPQRPVLSIGHVKFVYWHNMRIPFVGWFWDGLDEILIPHQSFVLNLPEAAYDFHRPYRSVEVSWTYGYTEIPDDIVVIVCAAANRAVVNPGSYSQESIGSYRYRVHDNIPVVPVGFTDNEREILNFYRRRAHTVQL